MTTIRNWFIYLCRCSNKSGAGGLSIRAVNEAIILCWIEYFSRSIVEETLQGKAVPGEVNSRWFRNHLFC